MDFALDGAQTAFRSEVIRFARTELGADAERLDAEERFDEVGWARCGRFGLLGLPLPAEFGGRGADPLTTMTAVEALAFGCVDNGLVFAVCNHLFACATTILRFGTPWQKASYLPGLARGTRIGALAMSEPGAGSDTAGIQTTAVRRGGGYVLNGTKCYTTGAPVADVFVVFARTHDAPGARSLSAFILERDTAGLRAGGATPKMGLRSAPIGDLELHACEVSERQRLGAEGDGALVFAEATESERFYLSAAHVGAMKRQLERSVRRANSRRQFGRRLAEFQAVSHKLARMKVDIDLAELLLQKIAWLRARRRPAYLEAAAAKLFTSESYVRASLATLEIHGALGYMRSSGVERQVRDALASTLYAGTSDIQRDIIATWLGLDAGVDPPRPARKDEHVHPQAV